MYHSYFVDMVETVEYVQNIGLQLILVHYWSQALYQGYARIHEFYSNDVIGYK